MPIPCPKCETPTIPQLPGATTTLVGYSSHRGHNHDDNCQKRFYKCLSCGEGWVESRQSRCDVEGCGWRGKETCFCHKGMKVKEWSDPIDVGVHADWRNASFE